MSKKSTVIELGQPGQSKTLFGDVLSAIAAEHKLNQHDLSDLTDYSQPAISRIGAGSRNCTPKLAGRLAEVLGGDGNTWLEVFELTKNGGEHAVNYYRNMILGAEQSFSKHGAWVKRLEKRDIIHFFSESADGTKDFGGITETCGIMDFDPSRVEVTSYDTRATNYIDPSAGAGVIQKPDDGKIIVGAGKSILVSTLEHIDLPSWLEAEIHPASNIGLKHLVVSHGPIIDPGWEGRLRVAVFNPLDTPVEITTEEPFLTLRFLMKEC